MPWPHTSLERNVQAALTSGRTSANAIYCPPVLQAALDLQSGILHAEEKDFKTAYSYFYETLEGYASQEDPRAVMALKYMLLCKIMLNNVGMSVRVCVCSCRPSDNALTWLQVEDVQSIMSGKIALRYQGAEVQAMKQIAGDYQRRSLHDFVKTLETHKQRMHQTRAISHFACAYFRVLLTYAFP